MIKQRSGPIRVLVVEDSPTARDLLVAILNQSSAIQVIGTALDGEEAVRQVARLRPDVVTMDIQMPRMNGLDATRRIMKTTPVPIVIVTSSYNSKDMDLTFQAMRMGALTVIKKPSLTNEAECAQVVQTVRLMADVPVVHRFGKTRPLPSINELDLRAGPAAHPGASPPAATAPPAIKPAASDLTRRCTILGIASSTGGPSALVTALKPLPSSYPLPILIVQHITRGFAGSLCEWLDSQLNLTVRLAQQGQALLPGHVLLAPDDTHMQVSDRGTILLHNSPPFKGLRPSANYLFYSMARVYGPRAAGMILTGMGDDGVEGLAELHTQGGLTIAQDEETSVVFGMPREAILRKAVDHILPIERISSALLQLPNLSIKK